MPDNLKQKTVSGLIWSTFQNLSVKGIEFILMLFMARLLDPSDYGILGMISIFTAVAASITDSGFANALIRKNDRTQADLSTVFFFNIVVGTFFFFLFWVISPYVADFYEMPVLKSVMRVVALGFVIGSFNSVQRAVYVINLDFKRQSKISITTSLISGICGVIMAFYGFGVWALVYQSLIATVLSISMYWFYSKWRPSFLFSWKSFKELFGFGSNLLISSLLNTIYNNIYQVVIGKIFSASALGHYSRASHWANFPSANLTQVLQKVTFPVLAKIQDDEERLARSYRRFIRTSAFVVFPLMLGMSAVARPLVLVFIGEKWEFCSQILQIICFSVMWYPIHAINLNLLQVKGRSDLFLRLEIIKKVMGVFILCISVPLGLIAMCYFSIMSSLIALVINTYYTGKLIHVGFIRQMKDLMPTLLLSVFMFLVVLLSQYFISNIYIKLISGTLVGAVFYLGLSSVFHYQELDEVKLIVKEIQNRRK